MASLVLSLVQAVLIWVVLDLRDKTKLLEQDIQMLKTWSSTASGSIATLRASVISNETDVTPLKGNPDL